MICPNPECQNEMKYYPEEEAYYCEFCSYSISTKTNKKLNYIG